MAAVNAEGWDILATRVTQFADALGEDFFDRPGTVDRDFYKQLAQELRQHYETDIKPYQPLERRRTADVLLEEIDRIGDGNGKLHGAIGVLERFNDIFPQLSGRFERYEHSVIRRRDVYTRQQYDPQLRDLFDRHARGECAFFFDLDGSLVHAQPGLHIGYDADERLQRVLNRLDQQSGNAVAVVTGRPDIFVEQVFPGGNFFTATEHGVIVRERVGGPVLRSFSGDVDIKRLSVMVKQEMTRAGLRGDECYVEDYKSGSLTAQFTEASDPKYAASVIKDVLNRIVASPENVGSKMPLKLVDGNVPGNRVMDLVPDTADKGKTLEWFYTQHANVFAGKIPVVLGDSGGDTTAMQYARSIGGIAIGVGPKAPKESQIRLHSVTEARNVFTTLAEHALNRNPRKTVPFRIVI